MIVNPVGVLSLSKREIVRFMSLMGQTIFPPLVTSLLFMYIFGVAIGSRIDFSSTGLTYLEFIVPGLMTMHLISSSYENTSFSLFIGRWHNHIQEILLSPLSYFEMVLGLLAGGVVRGAIVCVGVFLISTFFGFTPIHHPLLLIYFILTIAVIFSCAGMMAALWAEDFGMLNVWNIYLILPLVFLGGVFHPLNVLPQLIQDISHFNPMFYLVQGMRYAVTGISDVSVLVCALVTLVLSVSFFFFNVHLFRVGYKLRT
ncbi:MAG TPA: ABC transporter permease [Candidatus Omnitrophota bacterium]|nr:ABC transporter permease [Candidatus Omnitrophota bacterium]